MASTDRDSAAAGSVKRAGMASGQDQKSQSRDCGSSAGIASQRITSHRAKLGEGQQSGLTVLLIELRC